MRVSKNQVTLLSAIVAGLFATSAAAQVVLAPAVTGGPAAASGNTYAAEITAPIALAAVTVQSQAGIGFSTGQQLFYRYDLTNATIATAALVSANIANAGSAATYAVQSGGTVGSSTVIFSATAGAAPGTLVTDNVTLTLPNISITSSSTATITFRVFQSNSDAINGTNPLYSRTGTIAGFQNGIVLSTSATATAGVGALTGVQTSTASAASGYLNFSAGAAETTTRARIAKLNLGLSQPTAGSCGTFTCTAAAAALTIPTVINTAATTNTLTLNGDFSAAAGASSVALAADGAGNAAAASAVTATSATIPLAAANFGAGTTTTNGFASTGTTSIAATDLIARYTVNGTTALPISTYTASLTYAANAGYTAIPLGPVTSGQINRDGITLESPWATVTSGYISRYFITQTTATAVPYTATVRNANGLVGTVTGTLLPSGGQTLINLSSLLPATPTATQGGPYQVTFAIAATAAQVRGTYALTAPNGSVTTQTLYTTALQ
jgi:hypothetical protein